MCLLKSPNAIQQLVQARDQRCFISKLESNCQIPK